MEERCLLEKIRVQIRELYGVLDQNSEVTSIDFWTQVAEVLQNADRRRT